MITRESIGTLWSYYRSHFLNTSKVHSQRAREVRTLRAYFEDATRRSVLRECLYCMKAVLVLVLRPQFYSTERAFRLRHYECQAVLGCILAPIGVSVAQTLIQGRSCRMASKKCIACQQPSKKCTTYTSSKKASFADFSRLQNQRGYGRLRFSVCVFFNTLASNVVTNLNNIHSEIF